MFLYGCFWGQWKNKFEIFKQFGAFCRLEFGFDNTVFLIVLKLNSVVEL